MQYVILDLEFNGTYSRHRHCFVSEIIEFGAVKCDEQLNIIDTFSELVQPQVSKKLNKHVSSLTHLSMEELRQARLSFPQALSRFRKFLGDAVLLSWGTSDMLVLLENYNYFIGGEGLTFIKSYANAQDYCEAAMDYHDKSHQMGLSTCAQKLGIGFEDVSLHRAYNDAELTAACFKKLYDPELFVSFVRTCDERFYRELTFKNYNICDLKDPGVDKKEMFFICEHCGHKALRRSKWKLKNKSFRAVFRCLWCRRDFEGRITFKQNYDSVSISKRAVDLPLPEKKKESS